MPSDLQRLRGAGGGGVLPELWSKVSELDVGVTVTGAFGKLEGYSVGLHLLLSMFTVLTGCWPQAKVGSAIKVSLGE